MPYKAKKQQLPKPLDVGRLTQDAELQRQYHIAVQKKFDALSLIDEEDVNISWDSFCSAITDAATEVVGTRTRIRKPWLLPEAFAVLEQKANARSRNDPEERKHLQSIFRAKAKADHEAYLNQLADEAEQGVFTNRLGPVFRAIRSLAGQGASQEPPSSTRPTDLHATPERRHSLVGGNTSRQP